MGWFSDLQGQVVASVQGAATQAAGGIVTAAGNSLADAAGQVGMILTPSAPASQPQTATGAAQAATVGSPVGGGGILAPAPSATGKAVTWKPYAIGAGVLLALAVVWKAFK